MNTYRKTSALVGILYALGTAAGVMSVALTGSILNASDYLPRIAENQNSIIAGALCILTMGIALAFIPVLMFPVLKKQNEAMALGYIIFRGALETVCYIASTICMLLLVPLSRMTPGMGEALSSNLQSIGALLLSATRLPLTIFVFSIGALIFYTMLYRSTLIPRWLSVWGMIAIVLHLATGFLLVFGLQDDLSIWNSIMNIPILVQEMVMAAWFIVKGFSQPGLTALSGRLVSEVD